MQGTYLPQSTRWLSSVIIYFHFYTPAIYIYWCTYYIYIIYATRVVVASYYICHGIIILLSIFYVVYGK